MRLFSGLRWSALDQGLSSASNLLLAVVVARYATIAEFGAYGIAFALYLVFLGALRALFGEPTLLRLQEWATEGVDGLEVGSVLGGSVLGGVGAGTLMAGFGLAMGGDLGPALAVTGLLLPGLGLLEMLRFHAFAEGRPRRAACLDGSWLIAQASGFAVLLWAGWTQYWALLLAWGAAGVLSALALVARRRMTVSLLTVRSWLSRNRDLSGNFLAEYVTLAASQQGIVFLTAAFAGLAGTGAIRAVQTIMGPVNILTGSAHLVLLPAARRLASEDPPRLIRFALLTGAGLASVAVVGGAAMWLLPVEIGESLLGESWAAGAALVPLFAAIVAVNGLSYGATSGLRALLRTRLSLGIRLATTPVVLVAVGIGAYEQGARGALMGLLAAVLLQSATWWICLVRAVRRGAEGLGAASVGAERT